MSHARRATFYTQLAGAVQGGLPLGQAVALSAAAAGGRYAQWADTLQTTIEQGTPLSTGLEQCGEMPFAVGMIAAGENSGHLPEICRRIGSDAMHRKRLRSMIIGKSMYPVLLLHVASVLPPGALAIAGVFPGWAPLIGPLLIWTTIACLVYLPKIIGKTDLWARLALRRPLNFLVQPLLTANVCHILGSCRRQWDAQQRHARTRRSMPVAMPC